MLWLESMDALVCCWKIGVAWAASHHDRVDGALCFCRDSSEISEWK